jgi:hypothetical protein
MEEFLMAWYSNTRITAAYAVRMIKQIIPGRIADWQAQVASGKLNPKLGARKIANENGWMTRFKRWLGGRR